MERKNSPESRFKIVLGLIVFVMLAGTLGYMIITGEPFLDCLYMTVITITTVGYTEVLERTPALEIFSIVLILSGVFTIFYGLTVIMQMVVEGQLLSILGRRRMEKELKKLKGHYILAGYGRVGKIVYNEFKRKGHPVVVIESEDEQIEELTRHEVLFVNGNCTEDEVLQTAGIERATGIISAIPSEADNVYLALSARQLNPDLKIIARSDTNEAEIKLYRAGADRVICPYRLGGKRMALSVLRPNVVDFMELESAGADLDIAIEEVRVPSGSALDDVLLRDSDLKKELNLMVVAIRKPDQSIHFNPSANTKLQEGDTLVLIGSKDNLAKLDKMNREE